MTRPEPETQTSAKRTRQDAAAEMKRLNIAIDPQLTMKEGISSDPWLLADEAADSEEKEFVFVKEEGDEDEETEYQNLSRRMKTFATWTRKSQRLNGGTLMISSGFRARAINFSLMLIIIPNDDCLELTFSRSCIHHLRVPRSDSTP